MKTARGMILLILMFLLTTVSVGWAQESLSRIWMRAGFPSNLNQSAISPDGLVAIAGGGITVPLVRKDDGLVAREIRIPAGYGSANSVAFSADGSHLAIGTNLGAVWIMRVADGAPVRVVYPFVTAINSVAFSPDMQYLACASTCCNAVQVIRLSDGALVRTLLSAYASKVAFSSDGTRLLTAGHYHIRLWQFPEGTLLLSLPTTDQTFNSAVAAALSPDGQHITGNFATPRQLRLWRATDGALLGYAIYTVSPMSDVHFTRDGTQIVSAHEDAILVWDATNLTVAQNIPFAALHLAMAHDGVHFVTTNRRFAHLWRLVDVLPTQELSSFVNRIDDIAYAPNGEVLVSISSSSLRVWDARSGELLAGSSTFGETVAVSPDTSLIAVGGYTLGIGLYNWRTRQWINKWSTSPYLRQLEFSPDGSKLGAAIGNRAVFYPLDTYTPFAVNRSNPVMGVRWVDSQRCLILDSAGNLVLWNLTENRLERSLSLSSGASGVTITPQRHMALVNLTTYLAVVRLPDLTLVRLLTGAPANLLSAQLTPNGRYAVAGDAAGRIIVWRVSDGAIVLQDTREIGAQPEVAINRVAVAPSGDTLAYARSDANLVVARNPFPPEDVNGDGCVDDADLLTVLMGFGANNPDADVNGDGIVDDADLIAVLMVFGSNCD
ncbi:MAG: hypothetical protein WHS44_01185 [Fimbriimonadales bacterium]|nr:MAG: hypothetical protein KatS3mg018_0710 [Fimbriimonadales bacterium]